MKSIILRKSIVIKFLFFIIIAAPIYAQEFSVGTDVVSRYIWRGIDLVKTHQVYSQQ